MDAAALTCPQCGAAADADAIQCTFCHARLATVACPSCFGLVFVGSKHCAHFGKRSGIVLDACAQHGTWFDADELRRVVEFVRDGGLDRARAHDRMQLEEDRRLLAAKQQIASWGAPQPAQPKDASPEATGPFAEILLRLFGTF